ncbi:retropepsin-like aspartic protease, partial [Amphritea sp.]|uniref:retropepsin-like aspartic protease n=1 Tax=Amphritea sp. TaxID=1872502 RepID=UPI003D0BC3D3
MRVQKLREEAVEKERDEHFNTIWPIFPIKQRVKEKANTPALSASDDDMNLLDDDESPLIKDGSPPPTGMDINMVFALPTEFRGIEEEVAQMFLSPKEVMFEKPEESSQHLKPLYIWGHIDRKPVSRMLIDGGAAVNLMSYSIFKKLGREEDELVKTNLTINSVGGNPMEDRGVIS